MTVPATIPVLPQPDRSLWSAQRVRAYDAGSAPRTPLGVLRIPSISLAVPIYEGTADSTLDRGAGHIEGTAQLDEQGNVGIAAHRDGFFRALKDIESGHGADAADTPRRPALPRYTASGYRSD